MNTALPYRPNVCLFILNSQNQIFIGERLNEPSIFQLPQGGVEEGDSLEDAALREAAEELGAPIENFKILFKFKSIHSYDFSHPPSYAKGKYRGQSQSFWCLRYLGSDKEINLAKYHPEFMSFDWVKLDELLEKVEKKRRGGYRAPLEELKEFLK